MPQGTWDDERHKKLLLAILVNHPKLDFEAISKTMDDGTKAASIREHIRQLKMRVDSTNNTPSSTPAKKEMVIKPNATRAKVKKTEPRTKRRRITSTVADLGWGYVSDEAELELSEAAIPSKTSKIKSEPVDDTNLTDDPTAKPTVESEHESGLQTRGEPEFELEFEA
ncbi:hypothetical protein PENANT_c015G10174 [Penicillium antarcticum]|uniref:Myb-like domain-containing protein n=1 Tax=Penicillium antarcticum TaxID=416450 RepID=A0A1V6Q3J1_9EURO|nr:uncharacterized protein N7508_004958 [Penicillium antarcticum]KAJ5305943.1 hypothetical protein N7508_004958 [Penicillium antarcticum]OQD83794.1 hypothetical protein PENANT_c015G10174 [Penicillium antarcticum]